MLSSSFATHSLLLSNKHVFEVLPKYIDVQKLRDQLASVLGSTTTYWYVTKSDRETKIKEDQGMSKKKCREFYLQ